MVLFVPMQQELGCINSDGQILGEIRLDESVMVEKSEMSMILERLSSLDLGKYSIPMQDDD